MTDFNKQNRQSLIDYFVSGIKSHDNQKLGVEVEHFVVGNNNAVVPFDGVGGVESTLQALAKHYTDSSYSEGRLVGLTRPHCTISIEPAAQLEASLGEFEDIDTLLAEYDRFWRETTSVLTPNKQSLVTEGYNPVALAEELSLIPKERYRIMDAHFRAIGGYGVNMMRASCATQISIDYVSESDFGTRYRVAMALSSILAYMFDNTSIFEGQRAGILTRYKIWNNLDKHRTGYVPKCLDSKFGFGDYADYIMNIRPLFVFGLCGDEIVYTGDKTVAQVYADRLMSHRDVEHALSMVFPFVRLKKYIEIRMADSLPRHRIQEYLQIVKGVFYNKDNLSLIDSMIGAVDIASATKAWDDITASGDKAVVYNISIADWITTLQGIKADR